MNHIPTFEEFLNENLNEATTEFDFDPKIYAKKGVTMVQDDDYFRGRVVGKNYKFTNKTKDVSLKISRWYEGKAPDNYIAYLIVLGDIDKAKKIASDLDPNFKQSGSINSNKGTSSFSFSRFEISQKELEKILSNFTK